MTGSVRAMVWELWCTCRLDLLGRLGYSCALVALFCAAMLSSGQEEALQTFRGLVVLIGTIASVFSMIWLRELDREGSGFSFRLGFTRPVSTRQLVLVPTVFAVLTSIMCFLVPTRLFAVMSGVSVPFVAPCLFIVCAVVALNAAAWSHTSILDKLVTLIALIMILVWVLASYNSSRQHADPFLLAIGKPDYFQLGWHHYVTMMVLPLFIVAFTVWAVGRQRHGDGLQLTKPVQNLFAQLFTEAKKRRPFKSKLSAQFSYEFRTCGPPVLYLGVAAPFLMYGFIRFCLWMYPHASEADTAFEGAPVFWGLGLIFSPLIYQLLGADGALGLRRREGVLRFSSYDATRPLTNGQLIAVKMVVTGTCSLVGWLCMWVGAAIYIRFGGDGMIWSRVVAGGADVIGNVPSYWWFAAIVVLTMTYVSTTSVLLAFGLWTPLYPRVFVGLLVFAYISLGAVAFDAHNDWRWKAFWPVYGYLMTSVLVALCLYAIFRALRDRAIGLRAFSCIGLFWMTYVGLTVTLALEAPQLADISMPLGIVLGSLLLVPLAATACAPLALASQRHRA